MPQIARTRRRPPGLSRPPAARAIALPALAALLALATGGCGSKGHAGTKSTSTTGASSTVATAAPATTPTTAAPSVGYPSNEAAAGHLVDAWKAHDQVGAMRGATPAAVATMFAIPVGSLNTRGCDSGEFDTSTCVYRLLTNQWEISINMQREPVGWVVTDVQYSPPTQ